MCSIQLHSERKIMKRNLVLLILLVGVLQAQLHDHSSPAGAAESTQARIAQALSAGPPEVAKSARVVDTDAQGKMIVLREGSNGFTCMPGNLKVIGNPPMCADAASMHGWPTSELTNRSRPTRSLASPTCWRAPRNAVIRI